MIVGIFHEGSGLGNQLARYIATRVRATDLGVDWKMVYREDGSGKEKGFKGQTFMDIGDWPLDGEVTLDTFSEKQLRDEKGNDVRSYDPEFNFIQDNTLIDGEFQDERYWAHHEKELDGWLKVEPLGVPDDVCVIGFRGGEFALYPDLFLTKEYWDEGIAYMKQINPDMKFEVHTDDPVTAREFFPDYKIINDIAINWRSMRYAKYAIIANSSFFILPRWIRNGVTIAPHWWGRRNTKIWCTNQNYYQRFVYI